jgi:hypothetical protein
MESTSLQEMIIETFIKESSDLRTIITDSFASADRYLTIAITILVGGFTIGLNGHPEVLVALPYPIFILFTIVLVFQGEALNRAGHRCYIEEEVNKELRRAVLIDESFIAASRQGRLSLPILQLFSTIFAFVTLVVSVMTAVSKFSISIVIADLLAAGLAVIMLLAAFFEASTAFRKGYEAALATADYYQGHAPSLNNPLLDMQGSLFLFRLFRRRGTCQRF